MIHQYVIVALTLAAAAAVLYRHRGASSSVTEGFAPPAVIQQAVRDLTGQHESMKIIVAAGDIERITLTKVVKTQSSRVFGNVQWRVSASPKYALRSGANIIGSSFAVVGSSLEDCDRQLAEILAELQSQFMTMGLYSLA